eukprot:TRINITY_DN72830_c0_g1_i1.p1 TRINITY_DN72830_c0_g1~~TRINITY_DN72830_c0_g1_i1.p1  ORF type:complete len:294 (-),score=55.60 TRINITY_DN72830_c0_g1_i1:286-1167(-)
MSHRSSQPRESSDHREPLGRADEFYSILLPTYNERENLPLIIYFLFSVLDREAIRFEIIVVDDGSPDGTQAVCEELISKLPHGDRIKLRPRPGKLGLGSAYKHAMAHLDSECTHVLILDADLSHHPKYIPTMIRRMRNESLDIVTGTRYGRPQPRAGDDASSDPYWDPEMGVYGWNTYRKATSRGANFIATFFLQPRVSDLTGSFRLFRREALRAILSTGAPNGYVFQMAIIAKARDLGMQVGEVPVSFVDRLYGESKLGAAEIINYLKAVWTLFTVPRVSWADVPEDMRYRA